MVLGVIVLVVALFALRSPGGHGSTTAGTSGSQVASESSDTPSGPPARSSSHATAPSRSTSSASAPSTSDTPTTSSPPVATLKRTVPLIVLNNTETTGLAASAASRFESGGWQVTSYGNYTNNILSTCAYFDPSVSNAKAAAKALQRQYPTIERVKKRFSGLPSAPIVVVLTSDYSSD